MTGQLTPKRPISSDDKADIVDLVTGGLKDLVTGNPGIFIDRPGFIAGAGPTGPLPDVVRALTQYNCRVWAASDKSGQSARVAAANASLCGPYLDTLGENPGDGSLSPESPGGQCVGVSYQVGSLGSLTCPSVFNDVTSLVSGPGPVSVGTATRTNTGEFPRPIRSVYPVTFSDGVRGLTIRHDEGIEPCIRIFPFPGSSDNCGNGPASEIRPPNRVTPVTPIPPRIPVDIPGFGPVNVNINLDPSGDPIICFEELETCVTVEVGGDDAGGGGRGPTGPAAPPGDVGEPGVPGATGDGGEDEGEAPEGSVLVGLKLDVLASPPGATRYTPEVFRGIGYVYMGVPGLLDQDFGGSMVRDGQFLFAEKDNLTAYRVRANNGYSIRVTPYYREVE